jgi:hypothetical protein
VIEHYRHHRKTSESLDVFSVRELHDLYVVRLLVESCGTHSNNHLVN